MIIKLAVIVMSVLLTYSMAAAADANPWWNPKWRFRTTVARTTPYRDSALRPVEVAVDCPLLLERAGVSGEFDPSSLRVIEREGDGTGREIPSARRTETEARQGCEKTHLTWMARPVVGQVGKFDVYFDTKDRAIGPPEYDAGHLPPDNLLTNGGFESQEEDLPAGWKVSPKELMRLGRFEHTTGERSLKIVVDEKTPKDVSRSVAISQTIDVQKFAGQEMVFQCDLLAERAAYGAPVLIELQQFRKDGSRILECAVQPRWLALELAEGQLVRFCERGRLSHEAATLTVHVRIRCTVKDGDTRAAVSGPDSYFTIWLDRVVVRPGERWPWPAASHAGFVEGALKNAPLNRAFEFTDQRRLAFNGASEGTLTVGKHNRDHKSVHWGLQAGTLEFWCCPSWNAHEAGERVFFEAKAYMHRLQSRLRKLGSGGKHQLEFSIADADRKRHVVRGPAPLKENQWHHIAATWDFPKAHLQLFVDGKRVAAAGSGAKPWPYSLAHSGEQKTKGLGISDNDTRSMPMQAFIGGDLRWRKDRAAQAAMDEFRVSDVVRYGGDFVPQREEFDVDEHTRALFHFENERDGTHDSDDRFVRGHLACELEPQAEAVPLDIREKDKVERRMVCVKPHATNEAFETNRAESRMKAARPFRELPDPRFVEYRERQIERTVTGEGDELTLKVGGDFEPLMRSITFEHSGGPTAKTTLLPRWRANDNVVPFSVKSIAETLAPNAASDAEKAFETFNYSLETTNYYDAHYCETLPNGRHRPRVSYSLIKGLNIYPFDQCGPMNHMLRKLFLAAGISSTNASGTHHQFEQAFYDGSMRLFDLSSRVYWLDRDNATVLSRRGLEEDPFLKLRQGGDANAWLRGRRTHATFGTAERPHSMDFALAPGECVSFCWHNEGRWFELTGNREPIPLAKIPPYFGNGAIVYSPTPRSAAAVLENMVVNIPDAGRSVLRAQDPDRSAALTHWAQCPYIFSDARVVGTYEAAAAGAVSISLSFDEGKKWTEVWRTAEKSGEIALSLLDHVSARYAYWLKMDLKAGAGATVRDLQVRSTFIASPLALPGKLTRGDNRISFVGGPATVPVSTTCRWVERHKSDLGVSTNAISYYLNDDETRRNLFVAAPGVETPIVVTLQGKRCRGEVSIEGLPEGWVTPNRQRVVKVVDPARAATTQFVLKTKDAGVGEIRAFDVVVQEQEHRRPVRSQILVAHAPLVREAEGADEVTGKVTAADLAEASGARIMTFTGTGELGFDLTASLKRPFALWLRARWKPGSSTSMTLKLDDGKRRNLRATAMIGFTDWTDPRRAHAKMFAHFGEQYGHWSWYRIPDVVLSKGEHRLTLGAKAGVSFDALVLLPQNPVMDRAAMNLFQNWNYAPWENPH